jgi:beta-lactamase regulating signal transducer with metallopeptidase domain
MTAFDSVAQLALEQALTGLLVGSMIASVAALLMRFIARENSASRFAILYSALLAIVGAFFWRGQLSETHAVPSQAAVVLSGRWATYFVIAWGAGSLVGLARIFWGLWQLRKLRNNLISLREESCSQLITHSDAGHSRAAKIYLSDQVRVPTAIGFFRPAVILPFWAVNELSADELRAAVSHELAHLSHWDDWTNLLQKFIRALLFFHPAVWWIDSRLAIERELSCDDAVLASSSSARTYAECLVSLAEKSVLRRPTALAQAAVGRIKQTSLRVSRILNGKCGRSGKTWKPALAALGTFTFMSVVGAQHAPKLVSFKQPEPSAIAKNVPPGHVEFAALNHQLFVPASMNLRPKTEQRISHRRYGSPAHVRENKPVPADSQDTSLAKASGSAPARDLQVLNASVKQPSPTQPAAQFMYVVFQTREFDSAGGMRVTTMVWRVPIKNASPAPDGVRPHST